jgi:hypothetical protein
MLWRNHLIAGALNDQHVALYLFYQIVDVELVVSKTVYLLRDVLIGKKQGSQ